MTNWQAWTAKMIAAPESLTTTPLVRHEFALATGHGAVKQAVIAVAGYGVVETWINGAAINDDLLAPGWTAYEWRVRYNETDVTKLLHEGANVIGLQLGKGWYATPMFIPPHGRYGEHPAGFAELRVTFADGHVQKIGTDENWQAGPGPVTSDNLYNGQSIDARLRSDAWQRPGFKDAAWAPVRLVAFDTAALDAALTPPVRRLGSFKPVKFWTSPAGKLLVDFGQNLVGWVRVEVSGPAGQVVTLRHAEVIEHDELGTRPLRSAEATDRYTLSGGQDVFEPTLVFHGFRYVEIENWPGGIEALEAKGGLTAVVIGSQMRRTGWFRCSNEKLNQLHENVVWSTRGNFLSVPTDCPQRDERLSWTGDLAVFAPTAAFLFDTNNFLRDWLRDLDLEQQHNDGIVPWVSPDVLKYFERPAAYPAPESLAIWSDVVAWVPWTLWHAYGDSQALVDTLDAMLAHAQRVEGLLSPRGVWENSFQFGDWLDPEAPVERPLVAKADSGVVATQVFYRTLKIIAESMRIVGRSGAEAFEAKAAKMLADFHAAYVKDGVIKSDCTTVYSLAIMFDMVEGADLVFAGNRLAELARQSNHRISTGFIGTPFICHALTRTGHLDDAYKLLFQTENPSWLYAVEMGATTVWERWDSMLPDNTINPGTMTSFNHYAFGSIADWMHRTIGGIVPLAVHEGRYRVAPQPGGDITWAETEWDTRQGRLRVKWKQRGPALTIEVTVPEGATVELALPGRPVQMLNAGQHIIG